MNKDFNTSNVAQLYADKLRQYGHSAAGLSQGEGGKALLRYQIVKRAILDAPDGSLLDVGCGFGDTLPYLRAQGWQGAYTGIDIAEDVLRIARDTYPRAHFLRGDVLTLFDGREQLFDHVIGICSFTLKIASGNTDAYYGRCLERMYALCKKSCSVNFMSSHVDYQKEVAWHADPQEWLGRAMALTRCVTLDHAFLPFEFALTLRRASIDAQNNYLF